MRHRRNAPRRRRPGKTLVMLIMMLPALLGIAGLCIDAGILMATQRQAQNAADAAATAAALDLFRAVGTNTALNTANSFLSGNGIATTLTLNPSGGVPNALNNPPVDPYATGSPYVGNYNFVEVIFTTPARTFFVGALGIGPSQLTVRAVAGFEPVSSGEGAIVLDPTATPGLSIGGNGTRLIVNGTIVVNSGGAGYDQYGGSVAVSQGAGNQAALTTSGSPTPAPIVARDVQVVGGVDSTTTVSNIRAYDANYTTSPTAGYYYNPAETDRPLFTRSGVVSDPLDGVPTPNVSGSSPPKMNLTGGTTTLSPGVYESISISNSASVTFNPGIYVLTAPTSGGGQDALAITGGTVSVAAASGGIGGVMFYNAGSNYLTSQSADNGTTAAPSGTKFNDFKINGGTGTLNPYQNANDANDPFNGILLYQSRWNTSTASVAGGSTLVLNGTIYAKRALFQLAGGGTYNAQFVVGSMSVSGGAVVTINATGKNFGRANQVFLVE